MLHHLEELRMQHGLAARKRQVGDFAVQQLVEDSEYLRRVEFVGEGLPRPALLDAVQAGEIALVGDLSGNIKRRGEILRLGCRVRRQSGHPANPLGVPAAAAH
jgi:hypothetical protein